MDATIRQWINGNVNDQRQKKALRVILGAIGERYSSQSHTSAGLAIHGGGSTLAKTGAAAWAGTAYGIPVTVPASTDMPALVGTITQSSYNCWCFFVDSAGVVTSLFGKEGTSYGAWRFPPFPDKKALLGYIVVTNSGAPFIGGTTALDNGTVTVVYVNTVGAADPTVLPS